MVEDPTAKLLLIDLASLGACAAPTAIFLFVAFYTRSRPLGLPKTLLLLLPPIVFCGLIWTNPWHGWMWAHPSLDGSREFSVLADWGPAYLFAYLPYQLGIALVAEFALLRAATRGALAGPDTGPRISRTQAATLFVAVALLVAVSAVTLVGPFSPSVGPLAVVVAITSLCLLWIFVQIELVPFRHVAHRRILNTMPEAVFVLDERDRVLDVNPRGFILVASKAPVGRPVADVFATEPELLRLLNLQGEIFTEASLASGNRFEVRISPLYDGTGNRRGRTLMMRDITEQHRQEARLRSIVDVSPNGIVRAAAVRDEDGLLQDVLCTFANAAAAEYLEVDQAAAEGASMLVSLPVVGPQMLPLFQRCLDRGEDQDVELPVTSENDEQKWFRVIVSPIEDELIVTFIDISEEKQRHEEMREVAFLDPLTRVLNRRGLEQAFGELHQSGRRKRDSHALLYLDLDRFKPVNDTYGHAVGDRLLKEFAARLQSATREHDLIARVGGDEFVVVLLQTDQMFTADTVERLTQVTNAPYWLHGGAVTCRPSIGIAHLSAGRNSLAEALAEADRAMYLAKADGGGARLADPGDLPATA